MQLTIKNYKQAYKKIMSDLKNTSARDLLKDLKSYGKGSVGAALYPHHEASKKTTKDSQ